MRKAYAFVIAMISITVASDLAFSHRDTSKPLFVAMDGTDEGRCQEASAPCRSIAYALGQAGKGSQIRLASGRFAVENSEDLFMLVSGVVDLAGGYDRASGFVLRSDEPSVLTGVPEKFRGTLRTQGFQVIADQKGDGTAMAVQTGKLLSMQSKLQSGIQAGPCVGGIVDNLACDRVDLLAHVPFSDISGQPSLGNDVWGFVDLNSGREYVIAGLNRGVAIFDVTEPQTPREVGFIDGQNATWRDIKVYQTFDSAAGRWHAYAYVTTDGSSDGLFVIDLGNLPHSIKRLSYASDFSRAHNVYSTSTEFSTGLPLTSDPHLIIAGSNISVGQYRAYELSDPAAPGFAPGSEIPSLLDGNDQSYMHDAASLVITDARKDSQCINATDYCELLLDFNEEKVAVWDITDIEDPRHLNAGNPEYAQRGYVHSGWWSEDRQFMFVHDELDEQQQGLQTTLRIFSLADLRNPQLAGTWTGPTTAIDHNGFVRGNRYYMSNYKRGMTILDITDPANPTAAGHLDTYPMSDTGGFSGAWGVYPYLPSGTIAISDINSGLYLARDRSREVDAGSVEFAASSFATAEGQRAQLTVARSNGSAGAAAVDIEVVNATADGSDYSLLTTTLSWPDGDASARSVDIDAITDAAGEGLEMLLVRLVNPTGGATLGDRNGARLYISEPAAAASLRLLDETISVSERGFGKAVIVLQRGGNAAGPVSIDYSLTAGDATANDDFTGATSGTITWPDGNADPQWLEFEIIDDGETEDDEFFELTFSNPAGATLTGPDTVQVTILNGAGANRPPNAVAPSNITAAENTRVTLNASQSNDPDGDTLTYAWTQVSGPSVVLSAPNAVITELTTPSVTSDTLLQFRLTVTDADGASDNAPVVVTVTQSSAPPNNGGGGGAPAPLLLLALLVAATRRAFIRTDAA